MKTRIKIMLKNGEMTYKAQRKLFLFWIDDFFWDKDRTVISCEGNKKQVEDFIKNIKAVEESSKKIGGQLL